MGKVSKRRVEMYCYSPGTFIIYHDGGRDEIAGEDKAVSRFEGLVKQYRSQGYEEVSGDVYRKLEG